MGTRRQDDGGRRPAGSMPRAVKIYTRKGDDGTTGLLYGGRVPKHSPAIEVNGDVDEAQAVLGLARAEAEAGSELDEMLLELERDLYVLMAEVATAPANRHKLTPGATIVTPEMVRPSRSSIDALSERFEMPTEFVLPGQNRASAALDVARTVVRRAERSLCRADGPRLRDVTGPALPQPAVGPAVGHGALAGRRAPREPVAGPRPGRDVGMPGTTRQPRSPAAALLDVVGGAGVR